MSRSHLLRGGLATAIALAVLVVPSLLWASTGGGARDDLVAILLVHALMVIGLQVFTGNTGVLSFGHVALAGVGGYTAATLSSAALVKATTIPDAPWGLAEVEVSPVVALVAAVALSTLVGAVTGLAVARLNGLGAAIVTLALLIVVHEVLLNAGDLTGGAEALYGYPPGGTDWLILPALVLVAIGSRLLRGSRFGLRLQASREDELAAAGLGIRTTRDRWVAWVLSSAVMGLAGALLVSFLGAINPEEFHLGLTFLIVAMLVLGGQHSVLGGLVGATLVTFGEELARRLGEGVSLFGTQLPTIRGLPTFFLGAVVLLVMLRRPGGLLGDAEADELLGRRLRWFGRPAVEATTLPDQPGRGERLLVQGLSRRFGGLQAVQDVDLDVPAGQILGLIGPNGAGKTTLLNLITGFVPPTSGSVEVGGQTLTGRPTAVIADAGIARTFQNLRLFAGLSVRDNVMLAAETGSRRGAGPARAVMADALTRFDLLDRADAPAGSLSYGEQRRVEMARAVAARPAVLLLDEPAAGMDAEETAWLVEAVRAVRDDLGCTVVVIDHDLALIMGLCERIVVMASGRVIADGSPAQVQTDPGVVAAYLGEHAEVQPLTGTT